MRFSPGEDEYDKIYCRQRYDMMLYMNVSHSRKRERQRAEKIPESYRREMKREGEKKKEEKKEKKERGEKDEAGEEETQMYEDDDEVL